MIERVAGWLLPPSARESVLGDLRELYGRDSGAYLRAAMRAIPLVILSRMRRTTDAQALLTESMVLYLTWLLAAWLTGRGFLYQAWALWCLAGPALVAMTAMMLGVVGLRARSANVGAAGAVPAAGAGAAMPSGWAGGGRLVSRGAFCPYTLPV